MGAKNKHDFRYIQTEEKIKKAMQIISQKNSRNMSVQEICRTARLARSTFYRHYFDLKTALNSIYDATLAEYYGVRTDKNRVFVIFYDLLWFLHDNRDSCLAVDCNKLLREILNELKPFLVDDWGRYQSGLDEQIFCACRGALLEIIIYWLENLNSNVDIIKKYATILTKLTTEFSQYGEIFKI